MRRIIDPKDLSEAWQVPLSWIYARVRARELPHIKIGHYLRFDEAEMEQWLAERRRGAKTPTDARVLAVQ
jgi:excisionase family DNA binding protein